MIGQIAGTPELLNPNAILIYCKIGKDRQGVFKRDYTIIDDIRFLNLLKEVGIRTISPKPTDWNIGEFFYISPLRYVVKIAQE